MGSESVAHEAEGQMGYWLRGHERQRNNCFSSIQLVGSKISRQNNLSHGQKSRDNFAFLGRFSIHIGPTPPLTPQTMLDECIQNLFPVSTLYRVGGGGEGELQENFELKDVLF